MVPHPLPCLPLETADEYTFKDGSEKDQNEDCTATSLQKELDNGAKTELSDKTKDAPTTKPKHTPIPHHQHEHITKQHQIHEDSNNALTATPSNDENHDKSVGNTLYTSPTISVPHPLLYTSAPPLPPRRSPLELASYRPIGPRQPLWRNNSALERNRRARTEERLRDYALGWRFEDDARRMAQRERRRAHGEDRAGGRKTQAEELRECIHGIYPDMNPGERGERGAWICGCCVVM